MLFEQGWARVYYGCAGKLGRRGRRAKLSRGRSQCEMKRSFYSEASNFNSFHMCSPICSERSRRSFKGYWNWALDCPGDETGADSGYDEARFTAGTAKYLAGIGKVDPNLRTVCFHWRALLDVSVSSWGKLYDFRLLWLDICQHSGTNCFGSFLNTP